MSALRQGKVRTDVALTCPRCGQGSHFVKPDAQVALVQCVAGECHEVFVYDQYARNAAPVSVDDYLAQPPVRLVDAVMRRAMEILQIAVGIAIPLGILATAGVEISFMWLAYGIGMGLVTVVFVLISYVDLRAARRDTAQRRRTSIADAPTIHALASATWVDEPAADQAAPGS